MAVVPESRRWTWRVPKAGGGGNAGADQKVFRGQEIEQIGDFQDDRLGGAAVIFVREVVQNSRDAADDLRRKITDSGSYEFPDLEVRFEFKALTGEQKGALVGGLDLTHYAETVDEVGRETLGFAERDGLFDLDDPQKALNVLYVHEGGASGMYGRYDWCESKMYLALLSLAETDKPAGAGGSFGYGKAGLVKASGTKMVFAYSCFQEVEGDGGITRRALGVSYWPSSPRHVNEEGRKYDGWGQFGSPVEAGTYPFTDDEADELADLLGIPIRSLTGTGLTGTGTTFVLVDPVIDPDHVRRAAERYWWPALEEPEAQLRLEVVDYDGVELDVDPGSNEMLADFIEMYHAARHAESPNRPEIDPEHSQWEWARKIGKADGLVLGRLGVMASSDWSFHSPGNRLSLVALVRRTGMVVEYRRSGGTLVSARAPFVRGVFIADPSVNGLLQLTEPALHNKWKPVVDESDAGRPEVVSAHQRAYDIQLWIDRDVQEFRRLVKPPDDQSAEPVTLSIVSKAFTGGSGRKPPKRKKPLYEKRGQTHSREQVDGNEQMMRIRSEYEIGLQDTVPFEKGLATVRFRYPIQQDDKVGPDCCELVIDAPDGFVAQETATREADLVGTDGLTKVVKMPSWYEYRGPIAKGEAPAVFKILTKPFLADWILKPELQYTVVPEAGEDLVADETDG